MTQWGETSESGGRLDAVIFVMVVYVVASLYFAFDFLCMVVVADDCPRVFWLDFCTPELSDIKKSIDDDAIP